MDGNQNFGLEFSFGIDNGELDGLTPQDCFVLGYELARVMELAGDYAVRVRVNLLVHCANADRIRRACEFHQRRYTLQYLPDDVSESWMQLSVYPVRPFDGGKQEQPED